MLTQLILFLLYIHLLADGKKASLAASRPLQSPPNMASLLRSAAALRLLLLVYFLCSGLSSTYGIVSATTVHDILADNGLPKGLIPSSVKSYSLKDNGEFEVELQGECYVQFKDLVYYSPKITGKLAFGSIKELTGIQAKKLFVWVSVSSIELNYAEKTLEFHVGLFTESYPIKDFETIRTCNSGMVAAASIPKKPCRGFGLFPESLFSEHHITQWRNLSKKIRIIMNSFLDLAGSFGRYGKLDINFFFFQNIQTSPSQVASSYKQDAQLWISKLSKLTYGSQLFTNESTTSLCK